MEQQDTRVVSTESVQVERKILTVEVCENHLGRFLRLTEDVKGRRDRLVVPWSGINQLRGLLDRAASVAG